MWITPEEVLISSGLWTTELADNTFFRLQRRKGHGGSGLSSLLVGTLDAIMDSKTPPYRILHSTPSSEIHYTISVANTKAEIEKDWKWLRESLLPSLQAFEGEEDVSEYVKCKIESLVANRRPDSWGTPVGRLDKDNAGVEDEEETRHFRTKATEFRRRFDMPQEERLVNYYSCSYWKGRLPRQGWLYLSVDHVCFYAFILGKETKIALRWTDVTEIERLPSTLGLLADTISVS